MGKKDTIKSAWKILVGEGIITNSESEDIQSLIDYRNAIAHQMHELTADVGPWADRRYYKSEAEFDNTAVERILGYRTKIINGLAKRYVIQLSLRSTMFEAAERAYKDEITRLKNNIRKQVQLVREEVTSVNAVLRSLPGALLDELDPGQPKHFLRNGTLSKSGKRCCASLYSSGANPLAVAHLMHLSLRAAGAQYRSWLEGMANSAA